ncbi:MAG: DUF5672 family protein [Roseateles sp.]|nr:hypothetical protein [Burkholderiaceae bacterium]
MIDLRGRVTLVCVENRRLELAMHALRRSTAQLRFHDVLLFTDQDWQAENINIIRCKPIRSAEDYSRFMLSDFHRHIRTPHFLVTQWDGFVLNPAKWRDDFLDWDYIGAPWPYFDDLVGNGGFSLRSVRLHQAVQTLDTNECHPEDLFICQKHRLHLETLGMRFAPAKLAHAFSAETGGFERQPFGFHRFENFNEAHDEVTLTAYLRTMPDDILLSLEARRLLKQSLLRRRWAAALAITKRRLSGPWEMRINTLSVLLRYGLRGLFARRR